MSDTLNVWNDGEVTRAFGLSSQGEPDGEQWCFSTPFGPAVPSLHAGDRAFFEQLGPLLAQARGKLGKLSLSQLLHTVAGQYSLPYGQSNLLVSTWEVGPACDSHNNFELFTILAGLAHWHQLTTAPRPGQSLVSCWEQESRKLLQDLTEIKHPNFGKRAAIHWDGLVETWRNCLQERLAILGELGQSELVPSLCLGVKSFDDFVYLADAHLVHYNHIGRCRVDLPVVDLAALLRCYDGDMRLAENMLLTYGKVRPLGRSEQLAILAELWFPWEVSLADLQAPNLSILGIRRMQGLLERKIALVADLEELLAPAEAEEPESFVETAESSEDPVGKEVPSVASKGGKNPRTRELAIESMPKQEPLVEVLAEPSKEPVQAIGVEAIPALPQESSESVEGVKPNMTDEEKTVVEPETAVLSVPEAVDLPLPEPEPVPEETTPKRRVMVWKPFPRPLNAPADAPSSPEPPKEELQE